MTMCLCVFAVCKLFGELLPPPPLSFFSVFPIVCLSIATRFVLENWNYISKATHTHTPAELSIVVVVVVVARRRRCLYAFSFVHVFECDTTRFAYIPSSGSQLYTWRTRTVITGVHGTMNANVFASCKGVQYTDKSNETQSKWDGILQSTDTHMTFDMMSRNRTTQSHDAIAASPALTIWILNPIRVGLMYLCVCALVKDGVNDVTYDRCPSHIHRRPMWALSSEHIA